MKINFVCWQLCYGVWCLGIYVLVRLLGLGWKVEMLVIFSLVLFFFVYKEERGKERGEEEDMRNIFDFLFV